jgi:hypothetical protein
MLGQGNYISMIVLMDCALLLGWQALKQGSRKDFFLLSSSSKGEISSSNAVS